MVNIFENKTLSAIVFLTEHMERHRLVNRVDKTSAGKKPLHRLKARACSEGIDKTLINRAIILGKARGAREAVCNLRVADPRTLSHLPEGEQVAPFLRRAERRLSNLTRQLEKIGKRDEKSIPPLTKR